MVLSTRLDGIRHSSFRSRSAYWLQTYYQWRRKYGGLMPSEMKRLKVPEEENARLKKLVADVSLDELCDGSCKAVVVILAASPLYKCLRHRANHLRTNLTTLFVGQIENLSTQALQKSLI